MMKYLIHKLALAATAIVLFVFSAPLDAQTKTQKGISDMFLTALMQRDWSAFYAVSSEALTAQADSTQYAGIVSQLEGQLGEMQSRWLASASLANGYAVFVWNAHFEKDSLAVQIVVDENEKVSGIWFRPIKENYAFAAPPYADQKTFEEDRTIFGKNTKLPGTLTLPKGDGPFPAIVLVAGSGPNDRDETAKGNKPFRDIAWGLASQGIATFRYDKRTKVYGDKFDDKTMSVEEEVIIDALEALKFLASKDKIDTTNIFLLGHSLGGMMAPEIASRSSVVKGVILLAAPARDLVTVTLQQLEFFKKQADPGATTEINQLEEQIDVGKKILRGEAGMRDSFLGVSANYYYKLNTYNQVSTAQSLDIPIYIAQAGKDYQVPMEEYELWEQAIGSKANVTSKVYPDCFHLFITTEGAPGRANYDVEGHVTKELIDDLAGWVKAH